MKKFRCFILSFVIFYIILQELKATPFIACDCNTLVTKGILEFDDPEICKLGVVSKHSTIPVSYHLITKRKPSISFQAFMCEKWIKTLKITGSFWVGNYDTEHFQTTAIVEPQECWDMVTNLNCNGNKMETNGKTYSFLGQPSGQGSWLTTKEFSTTNCLAREIELSQSNPNSPIESPFGELPNDARMEHATFNKQTIVWNLPQNYHAYKTSCEPTSISKGNGKLFKGETELIGKIIDDANQVEIVYNSTEVNFCNDFNIHEVKGIPDTFLRLRYFPNNTEFSKSYKNSFRQSFNSSSLEQDNLKTFNISNENHLKELLKPLHSQFKEGNMIEDDNRLAHEINQISCKLQKYNRNQAIALSQINGILAANVIGLKPCDRLQGLGTTLLLQQCEKIQINITAEETRCGFQPKFTFNTKNYTIGIDGWSMHPYHECFWTTLFKNINGKTYSWSTNKNDWMEQISKIQISNLHLISDFNEIIVNDYNFQLQQHSSHELRSLEQLNVVNDIINRIQNQNADMVISPMISTSLTNQISYWFSWTKVLKIVVFSIIAILSIVLIGKLYTYVKDCIPTRNYPIHNQSASETIALNPLPVACSQNHSHLICKYTPNVGILWEDGCKLDTT